MAFPVASSPYAGSNPNPAYSGTFIPVIWSTKMIEKFYDTTVLAAISNTNYEGEIKNFGDKIVIRTVPSVTIRDYQANQALVVERPSAPTIEMSIDKGKYFNFVLDDVMKVQSDINMMDLWATEASEQMKITIDSGVLLELCNPSVYATKNRGVAAGRISGNVNLGATTTPLELVSDNPGVGETSIIDMIVDLGQVLDEQNVPETGRWILIPAWVASLIKKSELRDASVSGDGTSILRNGRLGMIDRFTLYSTNLLPQGVAGGFAAGECPIIAGTSLGLSFASQMTEMETLRSESTFGTLVRGLQVFGTKVIKPEALALAVVTKAS